MSTAAQAPLPTAQTITANANLVAGQHTPVDATAGAITLILPTPTHVGARLRVEKVDATGNVVTVTGTLRGVATNVTVSGQYDVIEFSAESTSSWRPTATHRSDAALRTALVPFWAASETVTANTIRMAPDGKIIQRNADGTARSTYDATEQALWTVVGSTSLHVASTSTASSATLAVNTHSPVDATGGAKTRALPTGQAEGTSIIVEKVDSSINAVAVTGNMRGNAGQSVSLVSQYEAMSFLADSTGSWHPGPSHKTKAWLDTTYARGPGVYVPSGWGANWAASKAAAGTTLCGVAVAGDSIGRGFFASDLDTKGWAGLLKAALQAKYGNGGTGFKGMIDSTIGGISSPGTGRASQYWSFTGSWSAGTTKEGPGGVVAQASGAASATHTFVGTTIEIFALKASGAGVTNDWFYQIDSGSTITVTGSDGTNGINKVVVSGLSPGSHTLKVTPPASGNVYLIGARSYNATGIVVDNYSRQGGTSDLFNNATATYGAAGRWSGGDQQSASLVIYGMLANDAGSISETTFMANLANYLESVRGSGLGTTYTSTLGAPDILVVMPHIGKFKSIANTVPLVERARAVAMHYGAAFVNFNPIGRNSWDWMNAQGYWSDGTSASGLAGTDAVHPSDVGHQWMYDQLTAAIPNLV